MGNRHWAAIAGAILALCLPPSEAARAASLTSDEVGRIIAQGVQEASARGRPATIAVVDRVGNVLGVFAMNGANTPDSNPALRDVSVVGNSNGPNAGLNGLTILPDTAVAIAKAITGAYLSSAGNAFSTRTASQIVQNHFDPGEANTPSGPLYGVQFSQLPCSDVMSRFGTIGPQRSPLGLSADTGGLPLYKNGEMVGGVGAIADSLYSLDTNIHDKDYDIDELVAVAAESGFEPPTSIRADRITVNGKLLRFTDVGSGDLARSPTSAPGFAGINNAVGRLVSVPGYYDAGGGLLGGKQFGQPESGVRADVTSMFDAGRPPNLLVDAANNPRYPVRAGNALGIDDLTPQEVYLILRDAYQLSLQTRAQIRNPIGSAASVNITVVDANGTILGLISTPDAPMFGVDVAVQKARSVAFLSSTAARVQIGGDASISGYLTQAQWFFGAGALDGSVAFSARAIGNLSRASFPDGIDGTSNGPFSIGPAYATVFATGLQLDLIIGNIVQNVTFIRDSSQPDTAGYCTGLPAMSSGQPALANGLQIFPGGFPIYRGDRLVGAIGVSGDGVDQDDLVGFLGLARGAADSGTGIGNAPPGRRADQLTPLGVRLRYVNCPQGALLGQSSSNLCNGF
jgi:uncharacterized protein GlcG (DUF336 family)